MILTETIDDNEFDRIERNIAALPKGQLFLKLHEKRSMNIALEEFRAIASELREVVYQRANALETTSHMKVLRRELMEMAASISRARQEIAALRPAGERAEDNKITSATNELDAIVTSTERASIEILNSAERMMALIGRLRRSNVDGDLCSVMESEVTNIFTACSFQDLTGQRTSKVVNALRYIEQRVVAMINIWGIDGVVPGEEQAEEKDFRPDSHLLQGPQLESSAMDQSAIDQLLSNMGTAIDGHDSTLTDNAPAPAAVATEATPLEPSTKKSAPSAAPQPKPEDAVKQGPAMDQSAVDSMFS